MEAILVEVVRGGVVEARHRVHAVAVRDGAIVASAGNPDLVAFVRSASKPIQALPAVRARPDLEPAEIAIASASHRARPEQLEAVRSLLGRTPATEDDLECGPDPTRIAHNCSGKHAAMLALCRARGWEPEGYSQAGHPCQDAMLAVVAEAAEVEPARIPTGVDGCGVLTFALTLERMAHAFSRLELLDGGAAVVSAVREHPELIRGPGSPDTELMKALPGWAAKGGAEAVLCAVSPDRLGITLKVEDGTGRALRPALAVFLERLGSPAPTLSPLRLFNSRRELVGAIRAATE